VATSEDCETAQVLINRLQDDELITDAEQEWLDEHLDHCGKCRAARGMIFEVAASYRLWAPVAVLATMKADVLAAAGDVVGADWSSAHLVGGGAHANGAHAGAAHHAARFAKRPRGAQAAAGAAVTAGIMAAIGLVVAGTGNDDKGVQPAAKPAEQSAPAKTSDSTPSRSKAEASASIAPSTAQGIHSSPRLIPGQLLTGLNEAPAGAPGNAPERNGPNGSPRDGTGPSNPGGGGPGGGNPGGPGNPGNPPGGGQPGNPPGGGQPGNPPGGGNPGGQPGNPPGGGNPGGNPGGDPGGNPGGDPGGSNPPPVTGGECNWPGQGNGPGGCPPGHGGIPPGQGGTPPGQEKKL